MKTRISFFFALAAMICVPVAFGQYGQQPTPPVTPVVSAQDWSSPAARNMQQPMTQNTAYGMTQDAAATSSVGCDGNCGQRGCNSGGGGGGCYDPCCPTKYFSLFGGAFNPHDLGIDAVITDPTGAPIGDFEAILGMQSGWGLGGAVGRSMGRRFRGEFEFTYRTASVDNASVLVNGQPAIPTLDLDGSLNQYSFMPNLLFDLNPNGRFNAYFGVGAGVVFNDLDVRELTTPFTATLENSSFAYQGIVGLSACINSRADVFIEYRYFGTDELAFSAATPLGGASVEADTTSNNFFFGVRVKRW